MSTAQVIIDNLASADRVWHLKQSSLLSGLSDLDLEAVAVACTDRVYQKDALIFRQGDPANSVFILNRGCVRIAVINDDDQEKILGFYTNGDIFGEDVTDSQAYAQSLAVAHEESWVSIISRENFLQLIRQRPQVALNYMRVLNEKLREAQEEIEDHSFLDTQHRLQKTLLKLAEKYGRPTLGAGKMVKLRISLTHDELARLIGANRPHVSTIISELKKKGWIDYQSRKILLNVEELKKTHRFYWPVSGRRQKCADSLSAAGY